MSYYKVTKDGNLYCVNHKFLRWQEKHHTMLDCDGYDGEYICSPDGSEIWRAAWLNKPPDGAPEYSEAEAQEITEEEYQALVSVSDDGILTDAVVEEETEVEPATDSTYPADATLEYIQTAKIEQMSKACNETITAGFSLALSDGKEHHFSLSLEDQLNLLSLQGMLSAGATAVPYHADGEDCVYYSAEDFTQIATAATSWKMYHESYFNSLRAYIQSIETVTEAAAVQYGDTIPEAYQTEVFQQLIAQQNGGSTE